MAILVRALGGQGSDAEGGDDGFQSLPQGRQVLEIPGQAAGLLTPVPQPGTRPPARILARLEQEGQIEGGLEQAPLSQAGFPGAAEGLCHGVPGLPPRVDANPAADSMLIDRQPR